MLVLKIRGSTVSLFIRAFAAAYFLQHRFFLRVDCIAADAVSIAEIMSRIKLADKHVQYTIYLTELKYRHVWMTYQ